MKRLPFFFIIFLGALGAVSFGLYHFLTQGHVIELGFLKPYYTPWLKGKGIKNADLFLAKETKGSYRWVLGARNIKMHGVCLDHIRLSLGWTRGSISIHHIDMVGLRIHLNQILNSGSSDFSPFSLIPIIINGSGSIQHMALLGTLPEWPQHRSRQSVESPPKNLKNDGDFCSNRHALTALWNVGWAKGKIRVFSDPGKSLKTVPSPFIQPQDQKNPLICLDIHQDKTGGHVLASIAPVTLSGICLGLSPVKLSGNGKARWSLHSKGLANWSVQWTLKQLGKSTISCVLLNNAMKAQNPKNGPKHLGVILSKGAINGIKSEQSPLRISATLALDQAEIYAQCTATSTSDVVIKAGINRGSVPVSTLHQLWPEIPETLLTRRWILNHIHTGSITKAAVVIAKNDSGKTRRGWDCHGTFQLEDLELSIKPQMPNILNMSALSTFDKKGFDIVIKKAVIDQHDATGRVIIDLAQRTPVLKLEANLVGPLATLFPILLRWSGHTDLHLCHLTGRAVTHITGHFPLRPVISDQDIHLNLHSNIPKAGFHFSLGSHDVHIEKTHLVIEHNQKESKITGKGLANTIPITWVWKMNDFHFSAHPNIGHITRLTGLPLAPYLQGNSTVIGACKQGMWDIDADFSHCSCTLPWLDWKKPAGKTLGIRVKKSDKIWGMTMTGDGVSGQVDVNGMAKIPVTGQVRLGKAFFRYAFTCDQQPGHWANVWHALQNAGHHQLFFRAPVLKLPALPPKGNAFQKKTTPDPVKQPMIHKQSTSTRITLDFACESMRFKTMTMDQVHLQLSGSAPSIIPKSGSLWSHFLWSKGSFYSVHHANNVKRSKSGYVSILWKPLPKGQSHILADMVDVGSVCNGLGITQRIRGGDLYLDAIQNGDGVYTGKIHVDHIKTKLGALGKLLTSISPTLFTELFSSGVLFNQVDADFKYSSGELKLKNAVAKGINLGLLLNGTVDINQQKFKIKGVSIPSYLINTVFSHFPFVGWVLGGKKGLLSSEFTVTGPWNDSKITTVPLSFFKLGFLKNIPLFKKSKKSKKKSRVNK